MELTKFVGVMGSGMIGTDPYEENAWSGSSKYFFRECDRQAILHRAFGVDVDKRYRWPLMIRNFSVDRRIWRQQFHLDTTYYDLLSRKIIETLVPGDRNHSLLQIGGIYDLRPLLDDRCRLFSYHDGNLAQAIRNPQFPKGVSKRSVTRALAYERRVYQNIDLIFTMSDYLKESFVQDFGIEAHKVKVIGAGINFESVPPPTVGKDYDTKKLLFVGADFERKGGFDLLRAFRRVRSVFPSAELQIVGPRQLAIPHELSAGVSYQGFLSRRNPAHKLKFDQILYQSSLFVMPSHYEPFGIAPLEAMAHEIPAVLTNAWAFPEMVTPGLTGELVKTADADELGEKIIDLLSDPDRLQAMGRAGRSKVTERYTWAAVVAKLRDELVAR